ncbi:hypothetical protein G6011_00012 [Alternaria panax]|uniref:DNA/RNA-binding domain-containing protein n=1 Tax=Alternaria panax TaxID=48097 RepID=A0AAD4I639_9PLEO|nr:hypothetical protein G6011_00012 [Alternaria panax]
MALLYETVPAFEDTWIECLGDLGRYRMAIEDEDVRDRETWAGVARAWFNKAADKNPTVGKLYNHLAILAQPNALQQMYYFARSLTCVKPFQAARETIWTLLDAIAGHAGATSVCALPIDANFINAHGLQFKEYSVPAKERSQSPSDEFLNAKGEFTTNLNTHIGRVTAEWKEPGVHVAVTNIAGWFAYGKDENVLRQTYLTQIYKKMEDYPESVTENKIRTASVPDKEPPAKPLLDETDLKNAFDVENEEAFVKSGTFLNAKVITNETFALILRRIGDKNVLPHVHTMLAFLSSLASDKYMSDLIEDAPWEELVAFLNALIESENQNQIQGRSQSQTSKIDALLASDVFPAEGERKDELPLPEDYLVRGLIWTHNYFPQKWFEREYDEEERYLELASTVKSRMERVIRLGYKITKHERWITYDENSQEFCRSKGCSIAAA